MPYAPAIPRNASLFQIILAVSISCLLMRLVASWMWYQENVSLLQVGANIHWRCQQLSDHCEDWKSISASIRSRNVDTGTGGSKLLLAEVPQHRDEIVR